MMHKYLDSKFNQIEDLLIESETQPNEEEVEKQQKFQNSSEYKEMKLNLKRLVDYNMQRLNYITILKIKKHYVKTYRQQEVKKDQFGILQRKRKIAKIIIKRNQYKLMAKANSRIQGVDLHTAQNLFGELIEEIQGFVNIRTDDEKKTSPIPHKCIIYFINKLLNFVIFFDKSDSETFQEYLKAVCILEDVAITHKATVKLYHAILRGIAFKIDDDRNHRKKVKVNEIKHPYERLGEGMRGFWTVKKDRLLLELYKEVKYFGPIRQYFEEHFPKNIELFSRDFFRQRTVSLLRRQIQRIRIFLSLSPASAQIPDLQQFKPKSLNRILKSSSCIELRLMLAQTSLQQTINLQKISDLVSTINHFLNLDEKDQLKRSRSMGDRYAKWTGKYDDGQEQYLEMDQGVDILEKRQTRFRGRSKKKPNLVESEDSSQLSDEGDELWGS